MSASSRPFGSFEAHLDHFSTWQFPPKFHGQTLQRKSGGYPPIWLILTGAKGWSFGVETTSRQQASLPHTECMSVLHPAFSRPFLYSKVTSIPLLSFFSFFSMVDHLSLSFLSPRQTHLAQTSDYTSSCISIMSYLGIAPSSLCDAVPILWSELGSGTVRWLEQHVLPRHCADLSLRGGLRSWHVASLPRKFAGPRGGEYSMAEKNSPIIGIHAKQQPYRLRLFMRLPEAVPQLEW